MHELWVGIEPLHILCYDCVVLHRLAQIGTIAASTGSHTVHHFAPASARERLSNSSAKAHGLRHFFVKWRHIMTDEQVSATSLQNLA